MSGSPTATVTVPPPVDPQRTTTHARRSAGRHLVVAAWLVAGAVTSFGHPFVPESRWLLVHVLLLGAVSSAVMIWSGHFAATLLRVPEGGRPGPGGRLALLNAGALTVTAGMLAGRPGLVAAGAAVVATAAVAHAVALAHAARRALPARFAIVVRYYVAAATLLPIGAGLGALLARDPDDDLEARLRLAHEAVNLLGWIGLTIAGTLLTLWPTMLRTRMAEGGERTARRAVPLLLTGVTLVAGAALVAPPYAAVAGLACYAAGLVRTARPLVDAARRRPPHSVATWSVLAAGGWLAVSLAAAAAVLLTSGTWVAAGERVGGVTAPLAVGWVAQTLFGALSYLVPVLVGGGPRVARATGAVLERGGPARVTALNAALAVAVLPVPSVVRVVTASVVLALLLMFPVLILRAVLVGRRLRRGTAPGAVAGPATVTPGDRGRSTTPHRTAGAGVGLAVVVAAVALGGALDPTGLPAPSGSSTAGFSLAPTGRTTTVTVVARGMRFSPARISVPAGDRLVVVVRNADDDRHDLVLSNGTRTPRIAPGQTRSLDAGVVGADLDGWCSVVGHRQLGMVLAVDAVGAPDPVGRPDPAGRAGRADPSPRAGQADPSGQAGQADHAGHATTSGDGTSDDATPLRAAVFDPMATPDAAFTARDARLEPLPATTAPRTHRRTLTVRELEREVAPGVRQRQWTFDGTAPGPTLHGRVGDTFEITLVNGADQGHSIDFHAGALAPQPVMRTIQPGESLVYRFTATRSGIWMYHCSTMPMSLHIANGMFGAVVVDPPGLAPVAREYALVQSEVYLGPPGGTADVAALQAERPSAVVFNGYAGQYAARPLTAAAGERVRIWVLAAGPNRGTAFHVVGGQFDTVYAEGAYRLRPDDASAGGAQVLELGPAAGGFVELTFPAAGTYPFVSHAMVDAERGARGAFTVRAGPP